MIQYPPEKEVAHKAATFIAPFEGFSSQPYLCPAGVWTIGYGATTYADGRRVGEADSSITRGQALIMLALDALAHWRQVQRVLLRGPTLNQAVALTSLSYNVGVGVKDGVKNDLADSSLIECFNNGEIAKAADHFLDWDKAHVHGKLTVLTGLQRRREAERNLFLKE